MPELTEVQPDTIVEAPESYEHFEARMETEEAAALTNQDEPETTDEVDSEISGEGESGPTGSAPATSEEVSPPAEPAKEPEPAPASEPVKPTQEPKVEKPTEEEKKGGIPQERFDEVTKARRAAERERDEAKSRAVELERQLADLNKPKPDVKTEEKPTEVKPEPKPKPKPDDYELGIYDDKYQDDILNWRFDERVRQQAEESAKTASATEAQRKADADKAAADKKEAEQKAVQTARDANIARARAKHTDFDAVVNSPELKGIELSPAFLEAYWESDDPGEIAHYLCSHPDEYRAIAQDTMHAPDAPWSERRQAQKRADRALEKVFSSLSSPVETKAAVPDGKPAAAPPAIAEPAKPKPPENTKPSVTRAPPPPDNVRPSAGAHAPSVPSNFNDWDEDEERRDQVRRRR